MKTLYFLLAAFSATWLVFFWYMYSIWRKQDRIEKDIQRLNTQLQQKM